MKAVWPIPISLCFVDTLNKWDNLIEEIWYCTHMSHIIVHYPFISILTLCTIPYAVPFALVISNARSGWKLDRNPNFFASISTTLNSLPPNGLYLMKGSMPINDILNLLPNGCCKVGGHLTCCISAWSSPKTGQRYVVLLLFPIEDNFH